MAAAIPQSIRHAGPNPGLQDEKIRDFGLDEVQMKRFGDTLRMMNLDAIANYASDIRQFGHYKTGSSSFEESCGLGSFACKVVGLPLCGSFHIVFTIEFDDGVMWMLKISANGHRFDSVAAAALVSEARTMQLIKNETTIPVPTVYAFDATSCNELNTPFILMERMDGQPLYRRWFDSTIPKAQLEHFRIKALQSLAETMTQLNKFTFNRGGALEFNASGGPVDLGCAKVVDAVAMYYRGEAPENHSTVDPREVYDHSHDDDDVEGPEKAEIADTYNSKSITGEEKSEKMEKAIRNDDDGDDEDDIFCQRGPFTSPKSAFSFDLDRSEAYHKHSVYVKGCYKALRMFLDMAISDTNNHTRRFVLTHPDLDVQNVLVAEDGTLRGLIDWDGVASVPREVGCAQYPLWLMRDWLPYYYLYDIREGRTEEDAGYEESPPAELASYRALYAHFMEKEIERQTGGPDKMTTLGTLPKQEAQLTRRSLVMRDLELAASSPFLTTNILCHILHQIERVTEREWEPMDYDTDSCSSSSSEDAVDSKPETNGDTNCDSDVKDPESEAMDAANNFLDQLAATCLNQPPDEGAVTTARIPSLKSTKVVEISSGTTKLDQGSQNFPESCRLEAQETKSNENPETDCSTKPAQLSWGWRLLHFGCNTAEKGLRRIAKIGHVLEDAVEDVADVLAEVEVQNYDDAQDPTGEEPALDHLYIDIAPNPNGEEPILGNCEIDNAPRPNGGEPVLGNCNTDKAAGAEELRIWEDIGLSVRGCGIPLDQLRTNQHRIFQWVVDTLEAEGKQDGDVLSIAEPKTGVASAAYEVAAINITKVSTSTSPNVLKYSVNEDTSELEPSDPNSSVARSQAGPHLEQKSLASKRKRVRKGKKKTVTAKEGKTVSGNEINEAASSNMTARTTVPGALEQIKKPETPSQEDEFAVRLVHRRESRAHGDETLGVAIESMLTPNSNSASEDQLQPKSSSSSLETLYYFGTSCLKKIFSNDSKSADSRAALTPDGSVNGSNDGGSDTGKSCKSSATSLSDDQVKSAEDKEAEEDGDNVSANASIFANDDAFEEHEAIDVVKKAGSHTHSGLASGLGKENGAKEIDPHDDDDGDDGKFRDDDEFRSVNIINLLGMDMLDERRLRRLREGFLQLLERY